MRTYKIHLGSGNILMEPNDQYLCIVPRQGEPANSSPVLLPFEGDCTLSIILSKAFILAEDAKIKDPTITQQIKPRATKLTQIVHPGKPGVRMGGDDDDSEIAWPRAEPIRDLGCLEQ